MKNPRNCRACCQSLRHIRLWISSDTWPRRRILWDFIVTEAPAHGRWGPFLVEAMQGEKFIPAMKNGQFVAGSFNYVPDAVNLRDPDAAPLTGSWIKDKDVR